ncbi:hypothetical protein LOK49_LG05G01625 [Camellia lanceoleosa]|uniref:Uncharacterized protein n=1 Tax=Camellia lanceoleosa TaxID=1840588 RepID=A0ACC0HRE2_9ERIC|nr:hypothetical protein LOK49_LG05G01625 [Camellia lanceoleosa]
MASLPSLSHPCSPHRSNSCQVSDRWSMVKALSQNCQVLVKRLKEGNAVDRVESKVHLNGHLSSIDYVYITEVPKQD